MEFNLLSPYNLLFNVRRLFIMFFSSFFIGGMMHTVLKNYYSGDTKTGNYNPIRTNIDHTLGHKGTVWYDDVTVVPNEFKTPGMQMNNNGWSSSPLYSDDDDTKSFGFGKKNICFEKKSKNCYACCSFFFFYSSSFLSCCCRVSLKA